MGLLSIPYFNISAYKRILQLSHVSALALLWLAKLPLPLTGHWHDIHQRLAFVIKKTLSTPPLPVMDVAEDNVSLSTDRLFFTFNFFLSVGKRINCWKTRKGQRRLVGKSETRGMNIQTFILFCLFLSFEWKIKTWANEKWTKMWWHVLLEWTLL